MSGSSESHWESYALDVLSELAWTVKHGPDIAPGSGEREKWGELVIQSRLLTALQKFNPTVPGVYLLQAHAEILAPQSNDAITENHRLHTYLTSGFRGVTYIDSTGQEVTPTIRLISADPDANDWLAVNQVTIRKGDLHRRFDIVLYCNGLPVSIIELKNAGSKAASSSDAHAQLATYLREFPMAFRFAVFTLATDGLSAIYGTPFTPLHHFSPWNVNDDGAVVAADAPGNDGKPTTAMEVALDGLYNQLRFLQLLRSYTAFDQGAEGLAKRIAKPHQYFAVTKAVASTIDAVRSNGKAGVVWHTQGSGKSMEMELYTNLVMRSELLKNPTVIVITDRTELDGQLFQGFMKSQLLPESPKQIRRRADLRDELSNRVSGGIYFTTLQKFSRTIDEKHAGSDHPELSDRYNIVVIVDEAHRSHYDSLDGYARHLKDALPHATLIAFTGTPVSFSDRNTREVFGEYIDVYDLTRAVQDGATVPVYFEPRLVKVGLGEVRPEDIDRAADEVTADLDDDERAQIERSVAVINAVYGAPERLVALAADLVAHWERRRAAMVPLIGGPGKAMIVGATREICARLYDAIIALRPDWHSPELEKGRIKVVYSGSPSDTEPVVFHVRRDSQNAAIKKRLATADDELEIVIVKDMMLTGYDSPPLHTLYLDRPLKGALLMQTLARVNRTFLEKNAGLLVGYAPLIDNLQSALAEYTLTDRTTKPLGKDIAEAVSLVEQLLGQIREALVGFDWKSQLIPGHPRSYIQTAATTANHIRDVTGPGNRVADGEVKLVDRYRALSGQLARAWALCTGSDELISVRSEVQFYEEVRIYMAKLDARDRRAAGEPVPEEIARLLAALISDNARAGEVLDIYAAAGLERPEVSELNAAFIAKAQQASNSQLAIEALRNLVMDEAVRTTSTNAIRQRAFSDRVSELMMRYTNLQLTAAQVIAELVALAQEASKESDRGKSFSPPLSDDELAFYDAVALNESAVLEQGPNVLAEIARDLVAVMRRDVRTDWTVREDVRAKLRSSIKRLLVIHGYPPDQQPDAIKLVMEQMEQMAPRYAEARGE